MTSNIYALLVGIDDYDPKVGQLQGCINDVVAVEEYLKTRVKTEGWNLHLKILKNSEATRQGIIDGFQEHLCQANSNDVALFYYAGHGYYELDFGQNSTIANNKKTQLFYPSYEIN